MSFPKTRDEMVARGYKFDNHARCRACKEEIEWWLTPRQKKMPFNLMQNPTSEAVAHHATCPDADLFRGGSRPWE